MRSASISPGARERSVVRTLTSSESSFHNAKPVAPRIAETAALIGYKTFADIAGKGALFVITIVAARRLTPWAFGVFGLGTTLGWLLSVVADFGVQMHVARAVAQTPDSAASLLHRWWRVRLRATVATLALLVAPLAVWHADRAMVVPLVVFAVAYAGTSLVEFLNYFYRGLSRSDVESTLTLWQRGATLVLGLGVLLWRPDVTVLAIAMLIPAVVTLAWSARFAARLAPGSPTASRSDDGFVRDVFPIGLGIVLSALYFRIDVLLVQRWAGTEAVAGYNAVFRLIDALRLFPAAVLAVVLPKLCTAEDLRPLARIAAVVTAFAVTAGGGLWLAADRLIPLIFGAAYVTAVPAFRALAIAFPLLALNFALTHQLVAWNRQRAYAVIAGAALAANLALNAWLIPAWSIEGAAWATLGTEVCLTVGCAAVLLGGRS